MTGRIRRATRAAALVVLAGLLSGCGLSLQGVPLPGGADLGSEPIELTVQFRDVLDLVPQSAVKVNNVTVGQVRTIDLNPADWTAQVRVVINNDVKLPANATAQLKQTTLLGEKYVLLSAPTDTPAQGSLTDGSVIPVQRTNRTPEAEEIFGALSMLLNGGGIGQVQSIARELNKALEGNEGDIKALLDDLDTLTGTLDGQRTNITRALDGVNRLSANLAEQRGNLDTVLTDLEPGLAVLNEQRGQLVGMLESLDRLSDVAVDVVNRSQDDLVADLEALRPTLRELARAGDTIPKSLEVLVTVPFTDAAVPAIRGDHANLEVNLDLSVQDLIDNLLDATTLVVEPPAPPALPGPLSTLPTAPLPTPTLPSLPLDGRPSQPGQPAEPGLPGLLPGPRGDK